MKNSSREEYEEGGDTKFCSHKLPNLDVDPAHQKIYRC